MTREASAQGAASPTGRPRDRRENGHLALEDGTCVPGPSCGAEGEAAGEAVFNTSLTGYQEVLTDPSYAGQIVTMTMPHIGNYGINGADMESRGFVRPRASSCARCAASRPRWRAETSVPDVPRARRASWRSRASTRAGSPATCASAERCARSSRRRTSIAASLVGQGAGVARARRPRPRARGRGDAARSSGATRRPDGMPSRRHGRAARPAALPRRRVRLRHQVQHPAPALRGRVRGHASSRPRPPLPRCSSWTATASSSRTARATRRRSTTSTPPCASCSASSRSSGSASATRCSRSRVGAETFKLKYGHRGGNQPVMNLLTGQVEITAQNHGFCVDFASIGAARRRAERRSRRTTRRTWRRGCAPASPRSSRARGSDRVQLTHVNLNDMTVEGVRRSTRRRSRSSTTRRPRPGRTTPGTCSERSPRSWTAGRTTSRSPIRASRTVFPLLVEEGRANDPNGAGARRLQPRRGPRPALLHRAGGPRGAACRRVPRRGCDSGSKARSSRRRSTPPARACGSSSRRSARRASTSKCAFPRASPSASSWRWRPKGISTPSSAGRPARRSLDQLLRRLGLGASGPRRRHAGPHRAPRAAATTWRTRRRSPAPSPRMLLVPTDFSATAAHAMTLASELPPARDRHDPAHPRRAD